MPFNRTVQQLHWLMAMRGMPQMTCRAGGGSAHSLHKVEPLASLLLSDDRRFVAQLPGEDIRTSPNNNRTARNVKGVLWTPVDPLEPENATSAPALVASSSSMLHELPFDAADERNLRVLAGYTKPSDDTLMYAQRYGGGPAAMGALTLGDGRVIALGELAGRSRERWEVTLKGSGPTPFRRQFDGRAVLRSCIREFVLSEALHAIGVPTQRSVAVVTTGEGVMRDKLYNGKPEIEPGAISVRALPTWVRVGTFELLASQGEYHNVQKLLNFLADVHLREDVTNRKTDQKSKGAAFLEVVASSTAQLVSRMCAYGFVHGVLNTDNISVLGTAIDYGPSAFMESFNREYSPFLQDANAGGGYCWERQKEVGRENCIVLAKSLLTSGLLTHDEAKYACTDVFSAALEDEDHRLMKRKLGLKQFDSTLASEFMALAEDSQVDFHLIFRLLMDVTPATIASSSANEIPDALQSAFVAKTPSPEQAAKWHDWLKRWLQHAVEDDEERREMMKAWNPRVVPRNHLLLDATNAADIGDYTKLYRLLDEVLDPFSEKASLGKFEAPADPDIAYQRGIGYLTCSS